MMPSNNGLSRNTGPLAVSDICPKLNEQTIALFGLRVTHDQFRKSSLEIPLHDSLGGLKGLLSIPIRPPGHIFLPRRPKMNVQTDGLIFNLHRLIAQKGLNELIITASALDAIFLWQSGYSSVALLANSPSTQQIDELYRQYPPPKPVLLILPEYTNGFNSLRYSLHHFGNHRYVRFVKQNVFDFVGEHGKRS